MKTEFLNVGLSLLREGYEPGAEPGRVVEESRATCESSECEECGHLGMEYRPFTHEAYGTYRAFAVCPECGFWTGIFGGVKMLVVFDKPECPECGEKFLLGRRPDEPEHLERPVCPACRCEFEHYITPVEVFPESGVNEDT